jgi:hypothetical protein
MAKTNQVSIPYLDPSMENVGISRLRASNVTQTTETRQAGDAGQRQAAGCAFAVRALSGDAGTHQR